MSAQPAREEAEITLPVQEVRDLFSYARAATAAALATRQPIDDAAVSAIAARHGVSVDRLKEATAAYLLRFNVQRHVDEHEWPAIQAKFVATAEAVADHIDEEVDAWAAGETHVGPRRGWANQL